MIEVGDRVLLGGLGGPVAVQDADIVRVFVCVWKMVFLEPSHVDKVEDAGAWVSEHIVDVSTGMSQLSIGMQVVRGFVAELPGL